MCLLLKNPLRSPLRDRGRRHVVICVELFVNGAFFLRCHRSSLVGPTMAVWILMRPLITNPVKNKSLRRQEMLSDDQGNEIIIEMENVPSGIQKHLETNQIPLRRSLTKPTFSKLSLSTTDTADCQIFNRGNDRSYNGLLRFSSLNESISQIYHGPECLGMDETCTFHETVQGIECSEKS